MPTIWPNLGFRGAPFSRVGLVLSPMPVARSPSSEGELLQHSLSVPLYFYVAGQLASSFFIAALAGGSLRLSDVSPALIL